MNAKYAFINSEEGNYPVRSMCRWARVSRSGYHEWRDRPPSLTEIWRTELGDIIEAVFADSGWHVRASPGPCGTGAGGPVV